MISDEAAKPRSRIDTIVDVLDFCAGVFNIVRLVAWLLSLLFDTA